VASTRPDPLWRRVADVVISLAMVGSGMLADALEDGARRILARFRRA
jgi:carbon monoxide dehydrogenase subunit G